VADVASAYALLLEHGEPGEVYNVASGEPVTLREVFNRMTDVAKYKVVAEPNTKLVRAVDIPYLVGDSSKLRRACDWTPKIPLDQTLAEVLDAQAD
jgi:GDP-4-dehydro-6-deoxy-D-mannose reductase